VRYEQHVSAGGVAPPEGQLVNPFRGDARSAAEGAQLFRTMNCDGCHGGGAEGWVGPSLISGRWRYGGADGVVFQSVYYGRPEGMPAFGGILAQPLAWKIVTYLKSLPPPKDVPTESW
jgi:cytochrome c oxidase cbb3-type subunit 3